MIKRVCSFLHRRAALLSACVLSCLLLTAAVWIRNTYLEGRIQTFADFSNENTAEAVDKEAVFLLPATGEILVPFSRDELYYNPAMRVYEIHAAVDFSCPDNQVYASSGGRVRKIYTDRFYGLTVEIEHEDGAVTRYSSLGECLVRENSTVRAGQVIARPGTSAPREAHIGRHLHFEYIKNEIASPCPFTQTPES